MARAQSWRKGISGASRGGLIACALIGVACGRAGAASNASTASNASPPSTSSSGSGHVSAGASGRSLPSGDWPTFGYNAQRSGTGPSDSGITAGNVGQLRLRRVQIDGIADSAPLELHAIKVRGRAHDLVVVTTTYGETIAIDPGTGAHLWEFSPSGVNRTPGNPQVTNASPTADPDRRFVYSTSPNGVIYKLSVASGHEVWARSVTADPTHEKLASSLNVSRRYVVAVTGGYIGDAPPYDGHVVTIDRFSGRIVHVWNSECSGRHQLIRASSCRVTNTRGDNSIWGRAGAVIEPGSGKILVATGNGPFDGASSWGDSVLELSADASRLLHNWTPTNQLALAHSDADVGSTSPALLPVYHGFRLAVQGGKDGKLHLLDLGRLDGTRGGPGRRLGGELQEVGAPGGSEVFTAPAVWRDGRRDFLFVATNSGTAGYELVGGGHPQLRRVWSNATSGTSPVVAGGLLYVDDQADGRLEVRQPVSGGELRGLPVANGHWDSPIVVGGRIVLPTGSYFDKSSSSTIEIYHLPGR